MTLFNSLLLVAVLASSPIAEARIGTVYRSLTNDKKPQVVTIAQPKKSSVETPMLIVKDASLMFDHVIGDPQVESTIDATFKKDFPVANYRDSERDRELQTACPTHEGGERLCQYDTASSSCTCPTGSERLEFSFFGPDSYTDCFGCVLLNGQSCTENIECHPNSQCHEGQCRDSSTITVACPETTTSSSRSCTLDADCECFGTDRTAKYSFELSSGSNAGDLCYACNIPDGGICDPEAEEIQCIRNSVCYDNGNQATCIPITSVPVYCPHSSNGSSRQCTAEASCECPNPEDDTKTLRLELQQSNGDPCYACALPEDSTVACTDNFDCSDSEVCNDSQCIDPQEVPQPCGESGNCNNNANCYCDSPRIQHSVQSTDGDTCYTCSLPVETSGCEEDIDCIDSQCYGETCTDYDDVPRSCPTTSNENGQQCSYDSLCSCDGEVTKNLRTNTTVEGSMCFACAIDYGEACTENTDCAFDADCYNNICTKKDEIPVFCPTETEGGSTRYCGTDSACTCDPSGSKDNYIELAASADVTCYACALSDGEACENTIDCAPNSLCFEGVCQSKDSIPVGATGDGSSYPCPKLEDAQCATDINCNCADYDGYTQKYLASTSGVACWACYEPLQDYEECTSSLFCQNYAATGASSSCTCVQGYWDTSLDTSGQVASFSCRSYQCAPTGGIQDDYSCIRNTQCASGFCNWPDPNSDGVIDTTLKVCARP